MYKIHYQPCLFTILFLALSSILSAQECTIELEQDQECCSLAQHSCSFGISSYYIKRKREGGSRQTGGLVGAYVHYERLCPWGFYWSGEMLRTSGDLEGSSSGGTSLDSHLTEWESEASLGYAFPFHVGKPSLIVPFAGVGYFESTNDFHLPSPMTITIQNRFVFASVGFLWRIAWNECTHVSLRFRTHYAFDAKNSIYNDPVFGDLELFVEDRPQYSIDLPIHYQCCGEKGNTSVVFTPFFQRRHLGGRENFPFDFIDTKFYLLGAHIQLVCRM